MKATSRTGLLVLLLPAVALYSFAVVLPLLGTFAFSFTRWNGLGSPEWAGIDNYLRAFRDDIFRSTFWHVGVYVVLTLVLEVLIGLCLAGWISARRTGGSFYRVALFIPVMLPAVVVAVLWRAVYNADFGLVNSTLGAVGLESWQQVWLGQTSTALIAISIVSGWVFAGFFMAIFLAAFARLPSDVLESARLDGAGEFRLFWQVKVPMIREVMTIAILLCVTGGIQGFDLFYVMTNGGPYHSTEVPTTYLVKTVFRDQEVGYGSAMAVIVTIVGLLIALGLVRLRRREGKEVEY